jgi:HSP20 family protein
MRVDQKAGAAENQGITAVPRANIVETPDAYLLTLDLPGVRKEAITLKLEKGSLLLEATVEAHHAPDARILHRELRTAGYRREFTLGDGVDQRNVDAEYADGVLKVKLFKTPESKPTAITIN